jgi:hypothetical protein
MESIREKAGSNIEWLDVSVNLVFVAMVLASIGGLIYVFVHD